MKIKVSVVIPTFNRASVLGETLNSIIAQTMTSWECIVVDDGSSDGTAEIMQSYMKRDSRIKYIQRPTDIAKGGNNCRNLGVRYAKGEFIQFLDSDDVISANKFSEQLTSLNGTDEFAIATCSWEYFTDSVEKVKPNRFKPTYKSLHNPSTLLHVFAKHGTFLPAHVYLLNRKLIDKIGLWKEDLSINQDGEFFNRVILHCSKIIFVPNAIVYYRIGTGNKTNTWSNEDRIKGLISSWQLIDREIAQQAGISNHPYVKRAKTSIYYKLRKQYPKIVYENRAFFRTRYSRVEYLILRICARLELMLLSRSGK